MTLAAAVVGIVRIACLGHPFSFNLNYQRLAAF